MKIRHLVRGFILVTLLQTASSGFAGVAANEGYTIAFGSCVHQDKEQPVWDAISRDKPDLFIFLGDNIYGDSEDMSVLKAKYDKQNSKPGLRTLRSQTRIIGTWDDHDYGINDGGEEYPKKEESRQLMLDFFEEPAASPRRTQDGGVYASYDYAKGAIRVILLDTRWSRSPLKKVTTDDELVERSEANRGPYIKLDPSARMLGETQWAWLEKQLDNQAQLTIIGSSIQFLADFTGWESWTNFQRERDRMLALLQKYPGKQVIFISGDMHYAEASKLVGTLPYDLWDLTSSGLTQSWHVVSPNKYRAGSSFMEANYGLLEIRYAPTLSVRFQIKDVGGKVLQTTDLP